MAKTETDKEKEAGQIAACVDVLAVFAAISPSGEKIAYRGREDEEPDPKKLFSGVYNIRRGGRQVQITSADIAAAEKVVKNRSSATLEDCRKALRPFAKLNEDTRVEDPATPILAFPGVDGQAIPITNAMIVKVRDLYDSLA
jgi:hypothetical protein